METGEEEPSKKRRRQSNKPYSPKFRSGSYGVLVALYRDSNCGEYSQEVTLDVLKDLSQRYCEEEVDKNFNKADVSSYYDAFTSLKTLKEKGLVLRSMKQKEVYISISESGMTLARHLEYWQRAYEKNPSLIPYAVQTLGLPPPMLRIAAEESQGFFHDPTTCMYCLWTKPQKEKAQAGKPAKKRAKKGEDSNMEVGSSVAANEPVLPPSNSSAAAASSRFQLEIETCSEASSSSSGEDVMESVMGGNRHGISSLPWRNKVASLCSKFGVTHTENVLEGLLRLYHKRENLLMELLARHYVKSKAAP